MHTRFLRINTNLSRPVVLFILLFSLILLLRQIESHHLKYSKAQTKMGTPVLMQYRKAVFAPISLKLYSEPNPIIYDTETNETVKLTYYIGSQISLPATFFPEHNVHPSHPQFSGMHTTTQVIVPTQKRKRANKQKLCAAGTEKEHVIKSLMQHRGSIVKDSSAAMLGVEPLQRKFSISACRRNSSVEIHENQFILSIIFSNLETNEAISFKQDGGRFGASQYTLKFATSTHYKIHIKSRSPQDFSTLAIGASEMKLIPSGGSSGEYVAIWNTADIVPTKKGTRQDIEFILTGTDRQLHKKLQVKFYSHNDSHAGWGQKLDQINWQCSFNDIGHVTVLEEQTI